MKKLRLILSIILILFLFSFSAYSQDSSDPDSYGSSYVRGNAKVVDGDTIVIKNLRIRLLALMPQRKIKFVK